MVMELDVNNINDFINYKVLLEELFFIRFEVVKKLNFYSEEFKIDRIEILNNFFSIVEVNYRRNTDLIIEKEIFDFHSNPQLFELNTKGKIFNFINNSHFSVGFSICLHFIHEIENAFKFIKNAITINNQYNSPVQSLNAFCFLINSDFEICNKIVQSYNKIYESSFSIIENYNQEGESFCIIELKSGSALDIFCFGAFFAAFQKFNYEPN